jgi:hypothetical protein
MSNIPSGVYIGMGVRPAERLSMDKKDGHINQSLETALSGGTHFDR